MRINRPAGALGILAGVAGAASAVLAPAAYAEDEPPAGGGGALVATHHVARTMVVSGGLPACQITVIAIGSAILGAAATVLSIWGRMRRRQLSLSTS